MSVYKNTKLCQPKNLDLSRIVFGEVKESKEVKGVPQYRRIDLSYKNDDGTIGELVMSTPSIVTSYGVSEIKGMMNTSVDDSVSGYQLPLVLYSHGGASQEQKEFVAAFESISEFCRNYVVQNSYKLAKKNMDVMKDQSNKFNPLWYKKIIKKNDKGEEVGDEPDLERGPTLYGKLIVKKKEKGGFEFVTRFRDMDTGMEVNPLTLIGKRCDARAVIKFESIFIGTKTTLQVKVREAIVRVVDSSFKSLLLDSPPTVKEYKDNSFSSSSSLLSSLAPSMESLKISNTVNTSAGDDDDEIKNTFDDDEKPMPPPVKKTVVRKAKT